MSIKMYNYIFYCRSVLFSIYCWFLNPSGRNNDYVSKHSSVINDFSNPFISTNLTPKDKDCKNMYLLDRRIDRQSPFHPHMCGKLDAPK